MQNRYNYLFRLTMAISDLAIVNFAIVVSLFCSQPQAGRFDYTDLSLIITLSWFLLAKMLDLYNKRTIEQKILFITTFKCICLHLIFFLIYNTAKNFSFSWTFTFAYYFSLSVLLLLNRYFAALIFPMLSRTFKMTAPVALLGVNPTSIQLADYFKKHEKEYSFAGFLSNKGTFSHTSEMITSFKEQIRKAVDTGINEIYISLSPDKINDIGSLVDEAKNQCIRLKFVPDYSQVFNKSASLTNMNDFQVINLTGSCVHEEMDDRVIKRLFDITFSLFVIVFIFSWLYPILALLIKLESPGPVIFKQGRSGRNNTNFYCYKFRSMRVNEDSHLKQASKDDNRITRIGRILRKTSLDELPQFFNVLLGNMSVVGPRPHMLKHTEHYRELVDQYMVRHYMKPGITGWAQVNGYRGETNELELMEKRVEHDIWYLENWSALLDVKIVALTVINIFRGEKNAY
jgi:putative colanic acid biosynthesis UDP-glucose lipid carrier transferase